MEPVARGGDLFGQHHRRFCSVSGCRRKCRAFSTHVLRDDCTSQYVGEYCQHVNPCSSGGSRCQNGGQCGVIISQTSSPKFSCTCPLGYEASLCEIHVPNVCDKTPCKNGGTCILKKSLQNYTCTCASGFAGSHCELVDYCASMPCKNGASCTSLGNSYHCKCAPGFTGKTCSDDLEECASRPCKHGTCMNTFGSYAYNAITSCPPVIHKLAHTREVRAVKCFRSAVRDRAVSAEYSI
ncbi:hypothetical protein V9T40_001346 [Parthenolecanium corni]|uniref:EGF-like domain-containing protein n=1 Tax=Parthenolecanium corni TaxID=536013 RepID=A0AAN9TP26_9HEMI